MIEMLDRQKENVMPSWVSWNDAMITCKME